MPLHLLAALVLIRRPPVASMAETVWCCCSCTSASRMPSIRSSSILCAAAVGQAPWRIRDSREKIFSQIHYKLQKAKLHRQFLSLTDSSAEGGICTAQSASWRRKRLAEDAAGAWWSWRSRRARTRDGSANNTFQRYVTSFFWLLNESTCPADKIADETHRIAAPQTSDSGIGSKYTSPPHLLLSLLPLQPDFNSTPVRMFRPGFGPGFRPGPGGPPGVRWPILLLLFPYLILTAIGVALLEALCTGRYCALYITIYVVGLFLIFVCVANASIRRIGDPGRGCCCCGDGGGGGGGGGAFRAYASHAQRCRLGETTAVAALAAAQQLKLKVEVRRVRRTASPAMCPQRQ
ncbi:hypothetical protein JKP88DRAFT_268021 [Tribonema minus]|uniref:Uncharacterized protein n=1 Tax=Tribonema minus TaxID=303371 RepID=A0A836CKI1_9STRA|nr:hypothetical protein JKP88DRAFT_268021 [Tribonema minus]